MDETVLRDRSLLLEDDIKTLHADWLVTSRPSGSAWWINVVTPEKRAFTIQVTPSDGVGVSELCEPTELDFAGHDEVFANLAGAIAFIEHSVNR